MSTQTSTSQAAVNVERNGVTVKVAPRFLDTAKAPTLAETMADLAAALLVSRAIDVVYVEPGKTVDGKQVEPDRHIEGSLTLSTRAGTFLLSVKGQADPMRVRPSNVESYIRQTAEHRIKQAATDAATIGKGLDILAAIVGKGKAQAA